MGRIGCSINSVVAGATSDMYNEHFLVMLLSDILVLSLGSYLLAVHALHYLAATRQA